MKADADRIAKQIARDNHGRAICPEALRDMCDLASGGALDCVQLDILAGMVRGRLPLGKEIRRQTMQISQPQFKALWAAFKKGGAHYMPGGLMGGAKRRMCLRMAAGGLLSDTPPFPITVKGMGVLREACAARWASDGCMAYQDDLKEVEKHMREIAKGQ